MQPIIFKFLSTLMILFSLQGYAQTTEKSEHPLLDKYYPQPKKDTAKNIRNESGPVTATSQVPQPTPVIKTAPAPTLVDKNLPVSGTNLVSEIKPVTAVTDTATINKPVQVAIKAPVATVQKQAQSRPPSTPYMDTRLGSSTPAYDTWEKNSNGAGSVTTSPK